MSLFADDIIVYVKNPQESTKVKVLFELLMEYIMVSGYKISIPMSIVFLFISSEHMGTEIQNNNTYNYSKIYLCKYIKMCISLPC